MTFIPSVPCITSTEPSPAVPTVTALISKREPLGPPWDPLGTPPKTTPWTPGWGFQSLKNKLTRFLTFVSGVACITGTETSPAVPSITALISKRDKIRACLAHILFGHVIQWRVICVLVRDQGNIDSVPTPVNILTYLVYLHLG